MRAPLEPVGACLPGRSTSRESVRPRRTACVAGFASAVALLTAAVAVLAPASASASPFDVLGFGARGPGMGNALTAASDGADAIFYNVGALAYAESGISVGALATFDDAYIVLKERPPGYDVPDLGSASPTIPSSFTLRERRDTDGLHNLFGVMIGGVSDLGSDSFRLGAIAFLPTGAIGTFQTHFADERERLFTNQLHFELIDRRLDRLALEVGLAYRPTSWLSVGLGGSVLPRLDLNNEIYVPNPTDQGEIDLNIGTEPGASWAVMAGAVFEPLDAVRIGVSWRQSLGFRFGGSNALQIRSLHEDPDTHPVEQELSLDPSFTPAIAALGASYAFRSYLIAADLRLTRWSQYEDNHRQNAGFNDTFSPHVGFEYYYSRFTTIRLGGAFEPTPVPEQTGRTNYVDNTRVIGSFGATHGVEMGTERFDISWYVKFTHLVERDTDKEMLDEYPDCAPGVTLLCDEVPDGLTSPRTGEVFEESFGLQTSNPGFPGFASGGWFGAVGVYVTWRIGGVEGDEG